MMAVANFPAKKSFPGDLRAGGARVIYLYRPQHHAIIFLCVHRKANSENLTPDQENG